MAVNYYTSEDAGAPVLSGQAGALIAILDAVLVNGYGSKPGLGWTIAFSDTGKRAYRLDGASNSGRYLRVDDSNAQYAVVNAFDGMTDIDTGTGGFPEIATPRYWRKSYDTNSDARQWAIYGDQAWIHLFVLWRVSSTYSYHHHVFGDLVDCPDNPGVVTILSGSSSGTEWSPTQFSELNQISGAEAPTLHAIPNALGELLEVHPRLIGHRMLGDYLGNGYLNTGGTEPNGVALRASGLLAVATGTSQGSDNWVLGAVPGLLGPWSRLSPANGTEYSDLIGGESRTYRVQAANYLTSTQVSALLLDITGPWR